MTFDHIIRIVDERLSDDYFAIVVFDSYILLYPCPDVLPLDPLEMAVGMDNRVTNPSENLQSFPGLVALT